jgi:hypothetical protein
MEYDEIFCCCPHCGQELEDDDYCCQCTDFPDEAYDANEGKDGMS